MSEQGLVNFIKSLPPESRINASKAFLFEIGDSLRANAALQLKIRKEIASYGKGKAIVNHDSAEVLAFFRYVGFDILTSAKKAALGVAVKTGFFKNYFNQVLSNIELSEVEQVSRFLLRNQHSAQRVAESIFPIPADQKEGGIVSWEEGVITLADLSLEAAEKLKMTSMVTLLKQRKTIALRRIQAASKPS